MTTDLPDDLDEPTRRRLRRLTPVERMTEAGDHVGVGLLRDLVAYTDPARALRERGTAGPWADLLQRELDAFDDPGTARDVLRDVLQSVEARTLEGLAESLDEDDTPDTEGTT